MTRKTPQQGTHQAPRTATSTLEQRVAKAERWARERDQPQLAELLQEALASLSRHHESERERVRYQGERNRALDSQHTLELLLLAPPEELFDHLGHVLDELGREIPRQTLHRILAETHAWWLRQPRRVDPDTRG